VSCDIHLYTLFPSALSASTEVIPITGNASAATSAAQHLDNSERVASACFPGQPCGAPDAGQADHSTRHATYVVHVQQAVGLLLADHNTSDGARCWRSSLHQEASADTDLKAVVPLVNPLISTLG
jgi:hypothetical protein